MTKLGYARGESRLGRKNFCGLLLSGCAVGALTIGLAGPVSADGGNGGYSGGAPAGGSGYNGDNGDDASASSAAGGGGGGAGGGDGGDGGNSNGDGIGGAGGDGGIALVPNGADGTQGVDGGGGGGGGGYHGDGGATTVLDNAGILTGGNGGNGGSASGESLNGPSGGGGGAGGYGAVVGDTSSASVNQGSGVITGGNGGNGGSSAAALSGAGPNGGWGGDGGVGVQLKTDEMEFTNEGTITGGDGGDGGNAGSGSASGYRGNGGKGGVGIAGGWSTITNSGTITGGKNGLAGEGAGIYSPAAGSGISGGRLTIVNSGTIAGGDSRTADGTASVPGFGIRGGYMHVTNSGTIQSGNNGAGYAIYFSDGGDNRLTLEMGSTILGKAYGGYNADDVLELGGDGDDDFDLSTIGTQYTDFELFEKSGLSTWTVTGAADASAGSMSWAIAGGTLMLGDPDTNFVGTAKIGPDGTLAGFGTYTGNLRNFSGGIVMPGSLTEAGKLTIVGDYTQIGDTPDYTGNLTVLVTPEKASLLAITGSATLGGTLKAVYAPGVYSSTTYEILTAASVSGTFTTETMERMPDGGSQVLDYDPTVVSLVLTMSDVGGGGVIEPTDSTTFSATGSSTINNSQTSTANLFDYLGGQHGGGDGGGTAFLRKPIQIAMAGDGGLAELFSPGVTTLYNAWFRATGRLSDLDGSGATPGFKTKSGGFMGGIDRGFGDGVLAGIAFGFDQTYIDEDNGNSGHVSTPRVALYGTYETGPLAFDATLGYAHHLIDTRRLVTATAQTAEADHGGDEIAAAVQASYRIEAGDVTITPRAGAMYTHLSEESFVESGAPGFNLTVASRNTESLRPFVGVDIAKSFAMEDGTKLKPQLSLEYSRETMDDAPSSTVSVGGGTFTVRGLEPSEDRVTAGLSLDAEVDNRLSFHAGYQAVLPTGNLFAQAVEVGLTYKF